MPKKANPALTKRKADKTSGDRKQAAAYGGLAGMGASLKKARKGKKSY